MYTVWEGESPTSPHRDSAISTRMRTGMMILPLLLRFLQRTGDGERSRVLSMASATGDAFLQTDIEVTNPIMTKQAKAGKKKIGRVDAGELPSLSHVTRRHSKMGQAGSSVTRSKMASVDPTEDRISS